MPEDEKLVYTDWVEGDDRLPLYADADHKEEVLCCRDGKRVCTINFMYVTETMVWAPTIDIGPGERVATWEEWQARAAISPQEVVVETVDVNELANQVKKLTKVMKLVVDFISVGQLLTGAELYKIKDMRDILEEDK